MSYRDWSLGRFSSDGFNRPDLIWQFSPLKHMKRSVTQGQSLAAVIHALGCYGIYQTIGKCMGFTVATITLCSGQRLEANPQT
jgi:hypothetical protein